MNITFKFLIVSCIVVLAACSAPRQAAPIFEVSPKSEIKFEHTIQLPETVEETTIELPENNFDPVFIELENTWLEIQRLRSEKDSIIRLRAKVARKAITITDTISIEFETFTIRWPGVDSVFTVIDGDTAFSHSYPNNWQLPNKSAMVKEARDGKSTWFFVLLGILSLMAFFAKKKK